MNNIMNMLLQEHIDTIYGKDFKYANLDNKLKRLFDMINKTYNNHDMINSQKFEMDKELISAVKYNETLFEDQENIVFTIGFCKGVLKANKMFFKVFGFENLKDFKKSHECVCELFIDDDGYLKETTTEVHWTKPILENPNDIHKALILDFSGKRRIYSVLVKKVELGDNSFFICTFTDVTNLETALNKLKASEQIKLDFMANMSHELRTPMNAIMGFTQLILGTELTIEQKQFLEPIEESSKLLYGVVNDILDFSKMETGAVELDLIRVNIFTDFYSLISLFKIDALSKNISYRVDIDPQISEYLVMDSVRILKILDGLINNAIKFTPQNGEVYIDIQRIESTKRDERISFSITDTGIGIKQDKIDEIFDSFIQVDSGMNREFGGTGLGLSICQSLCKLMGSTLDVKSTVNKGSSFSFELMLEKSKINEKLSDNFTEHPIYIIESSHRDYAYVLYELESFSINFISLSIEKVQYLDISNHIVILFDYLEYFSLNLENSRVVLIDSQKEAFLLSKKVENIYHIPYFVEYPSKLYKAILKLNNLSKIRKKIKHFNLQVLVAESQRVNRIVLGEMLVDYGIQADFAEDGLEAIELGSIREYDLILMEINMPNLNGVAAAKKLKEAGVTTPVVAVCRSMLKDDREHLLSFGLDDFLAKPIVMEELYSLLLKYTTNLD